MRTIYGLKMLTLEDITLRTGGKPGLCNFLKTSPQILEEFEGEEKLEIDTSMRGNFPVYNMVNGLRFIFVSIDLLEERMLLDKLVPNMEEASKMFITLDRAKKVERIVSKHLESYEKFSSIYSGEALFKQPCFMFVYETKSGAEELIGVYTAIPEEVIAILKAPIEYSCSVCKETKKTDNTSFDGFMPDIYYQTNSDGNVDYRCEDHKTSNYVHVGEKEVAQQKSGSF